MASSGAESADGEQPGAPPWVISYFAGVRPARARGVPPRRWRDQSVRFQTLKSATHTLYKIGLYLFDGKLREAIFFSPCQRIPHFN